MDLRRKIAAWPFRRKLLIFLLIIFLPSFVIIAAEGFNQRQRAITPAKDDALLLVRSLAAQQEQIAISTKTLLSTLAQFPEVQNLEGPACHQIFSALHQQYPFYSSILAMTPDGKVFAAHKPLGPGEVVNQSDRKYFQDAAKSLDFSAGEYIIGRVSRKTSLNYSLPVLDKQKKLVAVLTAGLNLDKFGNFISGVKLPPGSVVAFLDHKGVRLYRSPDNEATPVGQPVNQGFLEHVLSGRAEEGSFEWLAQDGVNRIYAFKQLRLRENLSPYLYVVVGWPKEFILHRANLNMLHNLGLLGVTVFLSLYLAWVLGNVALVRPMKQLVAAAQQFGLGKMETRTGLAHTPDELGRLAQSFDDMASLLEVRNREREEAEDQLSQAHEQLEQRVEERTAELVKANDRLLQEIVVRQRAEETLRESEERYRILVKNIPAVVCRGYWDWTIDFFDDKVEKLTGYNKEEFNSRKLRWTDVVVPEDLPDVKQVFVKALKSDRSYVREYRIRTKAGKIIWVQERSQIIGDPEGKVDHVSAVFFDITERRQAEEDLRRAHGEIEQIFASITMVLIGLTPAGGVWHWNSEAERVLGVKDVEALGQKLHILPIEWDFSKLSEALSACRRKGLPVRLENVRFRRQGGKDGFLGISISPIKEESGEVTGLILLGRDVTEKLIMETQLAQAQKLESIGQLAAGIAHEINTPIQYVGDNTRFLSDAFKDLLHLLEEYQGLLEAGKSGAIAPDLLDRVEAATQAADLDYLVGEIPAAIGQSLEGVERVARIVRAMKDFSHPGTVEKQAVDINKAIESTITVARNEWKYVAEVVTDLDPSLPLVPCRPDEFNQVVLNMLINAAHAIADVVGQESGEKGTITVKTRRNGDGVEVSISDTGGGIPEEIRSRIFDPFFTTKEVGKGTGQGLAISYAVIVEKHGGAINFETTMGQGTTFIISLPLEAPRPESR